MPDIKAWLEQAGEPVADTCFPEGGAPNLPYITFLDTAYHTGADIGNGITKHSLTVERLSEDTTDNQNLESLLEAAGHWEKQRTYLPEPDNCYETIYTIGMTERTEING